MPIYKQRDVVLIKFPYTSLSNIKKRPAVIVSADWYNRLRNDVIVLAITSNTDDQRDKFLIDRGVWRSCGLLNTSSVKTCTPMTLEKHFIERRLGEIPIVQFRELIKCFMDVMGYPEFIRG